MSLQFDTEFRSNLIHSFGESGTANIAISEIGLPSCVNKSCNQNTLLRSVKVNYPSFIIDFDPFCRLKCSESSHCGDRWGGLCPAADLFRLK